ncbi:CHASE2 domain-containing protein [Scytonema sp. UIC 10036]|uniref:CHASE2 domain-containing protein n=1 Tax=Scytonema sp. UIC 10036 TaxID=2304196 RepID=UPI00140FBF34
MNNYNQEQPVNKRVANLNQTFQGYTDHTTGHLSLVNTNTDCIQSCPFTYLITLVSWIEQEKLPENLRQPQDLRNNNLRTDLITYLDNVQENSSLKQKIRKLHLSRLSSFSEYFGEACFYPIIDYSLPPNQVYQVVNAGNYLQKNTILNQENLKQQVVLIGTAGYKDSGLSKNHSDTFPLPMGVAYWRIQNPKSGFLQDFTGVEINAYMIQNLIKQNLVIPIPDFLMIGIAVFLSKGMQLLLLQHQYSKRDSRLFIALLAGGTLVYTLISMQMYISLKLLLPLFLPYPLDFVGCG